MTEKDIERIKENCNRFLMNKGSLMNDVRFYNDVLRLMYDNMDLNKEIDRLKAEQPKWVSVSERLPEEKISPITHDYTEVVCYTSFGDVRVYKFGEGHFYKGPGIMDHIVTHWQYLPTPPKAGEQE